MPIVKRTKTFMARGATGRKYTIHELTEFELVSAYGSAPVEKPGNMRLETSAGLKINYIGKSQYEIAITHELLTSDDPNAP